MKISYSAPAKVILSGEHAVVYGKPALVSAINLRLKFSLVIPAPIRGQAPAGIQTDFLDPRSCLRRQVHGDDIGFIAKKAREYLNIQKIKFIDKPFNFKIESDIPVGRGLGSSASLSVASVAAFLEFYTGKKSGKKIVNDLAFEIEKHFHSNPSGVDNSASCFGGLILYKKLIFLKNLNYKISKKIEDNLLLVDSGKPEESTAEMVKYVSKKSVENTINKIEVETKNIEVAIKKENINLFKKSLINNEILLEKLGVVSEKTKKLLVSLIKFGVGKVTGAGGRKSGSGFILFFAENKKELEIFLSNNKVNYYKFIPDNKGLRRI